MPRALDCTSCRDGGVTSEQLQRRRAPELEEIVHAVGACEGQHNCIVGSTLPFTHPNVGCIAVAGAPKRARGTHLGIQEHNEARCHTDRLVRHPGGRARGVPECPSSLQGETH
jgi:hypothetical protein